MSHGVLMFAAPGVGVVVKTQSAAALSVSTPSGMRASVPSTRVRIGDVDRQDRSLDQVEHLRADRGSRDRTLVAQRIEKRRAAGVDERQAVGSAVLRIDIDDQLRSGRKGAGQRLACVLGAVATVDEHERDPVERRSGLTRVRDLHEAAGVGTDLVVVDLVDHQLGTRSEEAAAVCRPVSHVSVIRSVAVEPTST